MSSYFVSQIYSNDNLGIVASVGSILMHAQFSTYHIISPLQVSGSLHAFFPPILQRMLFQFQCVCLS